MNSSSENFEEEISVEQTEKYLIGTQNQPKSDFNFNDFEKNTNNSPIKNLVFRSITANPAGYNMTEKLNILENNFEQLVSGPETRSGYRSSFGSLNQLSLANMFSGLGNFQQFSKPKKATAVKQNGNRQTKPSTSIFGFPAGIVKTTAKTVLATTRITTTRAPTTTTTTQRTTTTKPIRKELIKPVKISKSQQSTETYNQVQEKVTALNDLQPNDLFQLILDQTTDLTQKKEKPIKIFRQPESLTKLVQKTEKRSLHKKKPLEHSHQRVESVG